MKKLIYFFLFVFFIFLFPINANAQEVIQDFSAKIIINQDGTINVIEKILYDFSTFQKHGIYRNIFFIKKNEEGKKYQLDFSNFKVQDESGGNYNFSQSIVNEEIQLKIGDANKLITGVHTYVISYKVTGALTYFSDHDELYWNVTGNKWEVPILKAKTEVLMPENLGDQSVNIVCYTGVIGSSEKNCQFINEGKKIIVSAVSELSTASGLTVVIGFPKNTVVVLEPKLYISFWETPFGKLLSILLTIGIILVALFWYILLPLYIPLKWYLSGRDPRPVGVGEVRAGFDPPKDKKNRFLTPAETGALIDEYVDIRDICALIVDLSRRGYMKIVEKKGKIFGLGKSFELVKNKEIDDSLVLYEKTFLNSIFSSLDRFEIKGHKMYSIVEKVKDNIYTSLVDGDFFPENPQTVRTTYYVWAGVALFTGNFHLAIIMFIFARIMPRKTLFGAGQAAVARSLKNFLVSQSRQLVFQAKNQMMFEKLLPYAIAYGVEKIWAERFKDLNLRKPDWYEGGSMTHFNSVLLATSLNNSFNSIRSSATPVRSSTGHSSGFSGGFSGGGGGGGGGGSW